MLIKNLLKKLKYTVSPPQSGKIKSFQWFISAIILLFIGYHLWKHSDQVKQTLVHIDPRWLMPLIFLLLFAMLIRAFLWARLIRKMGCKLSVAHLIAIWVYSLGGKYIPGSIWMIAGRTFQLNQSGVSVKTALYSSGLEQIITLAAGVMIVLATPEISDILQLPSWTGFLLLPLPFLVLFPNYLGEIIYKLGVRRLDLRVSDPPSFRLMLEYVLGNLIAYVISGVSVILLFKLFDTKASGIGIHNAAGFNAASFVGGYLMVLTPGGIGIRESIFAFLLSRYIEMPTAILIAFSVRIWGIVADITAFFLARLYFIRHRKTSS